ncbi:hypothetical protein OH492_01720 [Vibrio chagasii]|nr:hypothetical protein [Vibrio chagasii]
MWQFFDKGCAALQYRIGEWAVVFDSWASQEHIHQRFSEFSDQTEHVNFEPPACQILIIFLCLSVRALQSSGFSNHLD